MDLWVYRMWLLVAGPTIGAKIFSLVIVSAGLYCYWSSLSIGMTVIIPVLLLICRSSEMPSESEPVEGPRHLEQRAWF